MTGTAPHGRAHPDPERAGGPQAVGSGAPPLEPPDRPPILDQRFDGDSLYALRSAVEAHAVAAGMPAGRAEDIVICVHELATNAIRHGAGWGRARIWRLPGLLRCQVDDDGPPAPARGDRGSAGPRADGAPGGPGGSAREDREPGGAPGGRDGVDRDGGAGTSDSPDGRTAPGRAGEDPADRWPYEHGHGLWLVRCAADALAVGSGPGGTRAVLAFVLPEPGPRPPFGLTRHTARAAGSAGPRRVVLTATGDLDRQAGSGILAAATELITAGPVELVVDLRGIALWDTAGIAALSTLKSRAEAEPSVTLRIAAGSGPLRRRLDYVGLAGRLVDELTP